MPNDYFLFFQRQRTLFPLVFFWRYCLKCLTKELNHKSKQPLHFCCLPMILFSIQIYSLRFLILSFRFFHKRLFFCYLHPFFFLSHHHRAVLAYIYLAPRFISPLGAPLNNNSSSFYLYCSIIRLTPAFVFPSFILLGPRRSLAHSLRASQ